jgi:aminopeptidase N
LDLTPDLEAFTFQGVAKIDFTVDKSKLNDAENNGKEISLHAKELCFASASYTTTSEDGTTSVVNAEEIHVNQKTTIVKFLFGKAVTDDTITLTIHYSGFLNNQMAGFYRSSYTDITGKSQIMASTQFEALDARRAFPCVDEPAAKATFIVALTIPRNRQCFSNMPSSSVVTVTDTHKKVCFLESPRMSTYLLAFCVGEFDSVQAMTEHGVVVQVYTPPGKSDQGQFALECAVRSLDAYDEFFQHHYPLPKLDMVAIPEFAAGAMENVRTYHYCLLYASYAMLDELDVFVTEALALSNISCVIFSSVFFRFFSGVSLRTEKWICSLTPSRRVRSKSSAWRLW